MNFMISYTCSLIDDIHNFLLSILLDFQIIHNSLFISTNLSTDTSGGLPVLGRSVLRDRIQYMSSLISMLTSRDRWNSFSATLAVCSLSTRTHLTRSLSRTSTFLSVQGVSSISLAEATNTYRYHF